MVENLTNRFWKFIKRPEGNAYDEAFTLEETPLVAPVDGQVIVKNQYLSLDAGTRMWITGREDGYQPPLDLNIPMVGLGLGEVIASSDPNFVEGDLVRGFGQWADYSLVTAELSGLMKLDKSIDDIRQHLGVLGFTGWTGMWGIMETGEAKAGENVLVSAAGGAAGMVACQIAKNLGCHVYGTAGGADKCAFLEKEFGITAIDYKSENVEERLAQIEGGIDVYFDNVGGPQLDAVFPNMANYGRIAISGLIAEYSGQPTHPARFDQILMKRLTVKGFFSPDFADQGPRLTEALKEQYLAGKLNMPFDVTDGLDNMLAAYTKLFTGGNIGKTLVKLF